MKIEQHAGFYLITPGDDHVALRNVRALPSRKFDARAKLWRAPVTIENYQALMDMGYDPPGGEPQDTGYRIDTLRGKLVVHVPFSPANVRKCKAIPEQRSWNVRHRAWICSPTAANIDYLEASFPTADWTEQAEMFRLQVVQAREDALSLSVRKRRIGEGGELNVNGYEFLTTPFRHQLEAFVLSREALNFALIMEQGTGKTKVLIDTAVYLWEQGKINGVLVIAPNSVKPVWTQDELPTHMPKRAIGTAWEYNAGASKKDKQALEDWVQGYRPGTLDWLVMNVETFSSSLTAIKLAEKFLKSRSCMMTIDESTRIKSPKAKRTKRMMRLGKLANYRRILTGTPVTNGPLDAYTQFNFLDPHILGFGSFYTFRNHYAIMGGYGGYQILGYSHLEELVEKIQPFSFRVERAKCLDLPPKVYQKRHVDLTPAQRRAYEEMRDLMVTQIGGERVSVALVLTQLMRLQQIVGGFTLLDANEDGETVEIMPPSENPKLNALLELADDTQGGMIIWSRFRPELAMIATALRTKYGPETVAEFHGGISTEMRVEARRRFQDPDDPCRFFVGNQAAGGLGITLTQAQTVAYYSNTFSLEDRLQSEDRAHRIGQKHTVLYVDIVANDTLDTKRIIPALRLKHNFADQITGDEWKEWI